MTTNVTAPLNSPVAAGASPPVSTASGTARTPSAATSVPLANANSTPVTRSGAAHQAPTTPPITNAPEPIKPMIRASTTADLYPRTGRPQRNDGRAGLEIGQMAPTST